MSYGVKPRNYRLPESAHIGRVRLQVADLERSIAYYETVIGFRVLGRDERVARMGAQGDDRVLVELHEKPGVRSVARRGHIGLYHFAILLPDRAALGRFLAHLGELGVRAGMSDHIVSEALYLTDPDGLGIEVYADRPRSTWRELDSQLAMASDPLDVDSVIAAAKGEPWTGAPLGTTIGHVHLYVRDLEQAEGFYHQGLGLDKIVWSYPGALFMSAGGYHHHLGTNTWATGAPLATDDEARLLDWEVVVPTAADADAAAQSISDAGHPVERSEQGHTARDPWGTALRVVADR
jgi:catechol 2,3-dioxygenase